MTKENKEEKLKTEPLKKGEKKAAAAEKKLSGKEAKKQALADLVEKGKKNNGELSYKDVISRFEGIEIDAEQIEKVYEYLNCPVSDFI